MSSIRQIIYLCFFIALIAAISLAITQLINENNHYIAKSEETFTVPNVTPGEIKIINWDTVNKLMETCQIKVIFQKHSLEVTLRDDYDQIYQTTEPEIDAIFDLAKKHQGPCDIVQMITE